MNNLDDKQQTKRIPQLRRPLNWPWIWDVLIIGVLLIGAYFRFTGIRWDEGYHLHPDERFLTMVETSISPVENLNQYFDTVNSSLNPNNRGYGFYVYGTLPLFFVRYLGEWIGQTGYDQINVVGRVVSGAFDLGTILFVYLIGKRLYKNSRLGLLAALFSALAVLQIQLSHYFTVDNVANFFAYAAIYAAVCLMTADSVIEILPEEAAPKESFFRTMLKHWGSFGAYAAFGILFGMAMASKVSILPLAFLLPIAAFIYFVKLPRESRIYEANIILRNVVFAGILALLTFRIFQPYAFMGPGFFGIKLNPNWIANLKELSNLSTGDVDVPYALQWARRPITFALENIVKWGLGIPLGVLAWLGFLYMGWRMVKGDWQKHLLIWGWTAFFFLTQSIAWVRSMRYQLPIYPALALIAAWSVFKLWENGAGVIKKVTSFQINWRRMIAVSAAAITIVGTVIWAIAFSSIYTKPVTRVAASEWFYQHVFGAISAQISPQTGLPVTQPIAYQSTALVSAETPYVYGFTAKTGGKLSEVTLEHVLNQQPEYNSLSLLVTIREPDENGYIYKTAAFLQSTFQPVSDVKGDAAKVVFQHPAQLESGKFYQLVIEVVEPGMLLKLDGGVWMTFGSGVNKSVQYLPSPAYRLTSDTPFQASFLPQTSGTISQIRLNRVVDLLALSDSKTLTLTIFDSTLPEQILATGKIKDQFLPDSDPRGDTHLIQLDKPLVLDLNIVYTFKLTLSGGDGALAIYNDAPAIESTWDDPLPLGMYGYNLFGYETGIYGNTRNLEMYWDDTEQKRDLFYSTLDQSDAISISSNRQWGTTVRVPERYPLTSEYYRALLGCPEDKAITWCYSVAKPGMFTGQLGFELTAVFQNDPAIGGLSFNDQFAEEAFTVYDHPKVLIFQKTDAYTSENMRQILGAVDISKAVHKTPRQASKFAGNLYLDTKSQELQTNGGTWSELFPADFILNINPWLAAVAWYLSILVLGLIVYPIVRVVFHGLPDRGYPFSRLSGLILTAYLTWLASSTVAQFNRLTIGLVLVLLVIISGFLAFKQRQELLIELKTKKRYFLTIEMLMAVLFLISLAIRLGNPDLWHPWKGGEKPMDLSYFTAVLKSTVFPPYDPWYSGGYINYYYFGFVLVGVPVKFLGISPGIAYNLILPTLFALTGLGAFSIGWNLFANKKQEESLDPLGVTQNKPRSFLAGIISVFTVLIMGNLGTLRMFWQGLQRMVAPDGVIDNARFFEHISWFFQGLVKFVSGTKLSYGYGDWYWIPSRALPGDTITEFPFFTFTYADLHAHMIALPITILVLGWALGILLAKWDWSNGSGIKRWVSIGITLVFGGVSIGMLRVTNTWDLPTYLALAALVVLYTIFRYAEIPERFFPAFPEWLRKGFYTAGILVLLTGLVLAFYLPFSKNYGQSYGAIDPWKGDRSPFWSYIVHWGLQLFLIATWFVWETREWLAATPMSALKKIKPYLGYLQVLFILFALVLLLLTILGIKIGWLAGLLAVWALLLMLRLGQSDLKRLILFMIGTGLVLTLFVEMFVLVGDIGRMNTVFKFYYQAWTLLGLSSAAALIWLIPAVTTVWKERYSSVWQVILAILIFGVSLYPLTAAADKIRDRMSKEAPHTLNGLEFMQTSTYNDQGIDMDLSQDYAAIKWMQNNVAGSPVIVETNTVEYRWGNRFTIYTGLPGVLGWNWHQRQQRGFLDYNGISSRLTDIPNFYTSTNIDDALGFIKKYDVKYIILGQMERVYYPGEGLDKFEQYDGTCWKEVFRERDTVIYEVVD